MAGKRKQTRGKGVIPSELDCPIGLEHRRRRAHTRTGSCLQMSPKGKRRGGESESPYTATSVLTMRQLADWRAVCGRSARPVRREGRRNPMRRSYPYPSAAMDSAGKRPCVSTSAAWMAITSLRTGWSLSSAACWSGCSRYMSGCYVRSNLELLCGYAVTVNSMSSVVAERSVLTIGASVRACSNNARTSGSGVPVPA